MHICYILYSATLGKYYIGSTSDVLAERIRRHNTNHIGFTGGVGDWELLHSELFETKKEARQREFQIKKWKSKKMIEKLIRDASGSEHPDL